KPRSGSSLRRSKCDISIHRTEPASHVSKHETQKMLLTYSPNRQDPGASLLGHAKAVMVMSYLDPGEAHRVEVVKRMEGIVAAKQIAEFEKTEKEWSPTVFPTRKSHQFFRIRKTGISLSRSTKRRRSDSNRCIKVLQTSPLPLG